MGPESFAVRKRHGELAEFLRSLARYADDARALLEVVHPQRRGKPRRARSRQHMIRAGAVVSQRLGGVTPQKNRAGVADLLQPLFRFGDRELQVLRSNPVGDVTSLVDAF